MRVVMVHGYEMLKLERCLRKQLQGMSQYAKAECLNDVAQKTMPGGS